MIHPLTELRFIDPEIGYGVFATKNIPIGTIVYVRDALEPTITPSRYKVLPQMLKDIVQKYSYKDNSGDYVLSWDFGRFVNHSCEANTLTSGYGFEIAIRDIKAGEEITDDYALLNLEKEMFCGCGSPNCRKLIEPSDFDLFLGEYDQKIKAAMGYALSVHQPLWEVLSADIVDVLINNSSNGIEHLSVINQKIRPNQLAG